MRGEGILSKRNQKRSQTIAFNGQKCAETAQNSTVPAQMPPKRPFLAVKCTWLALFLVSFGQDAFPIHRLRQLCAVPCVHRRSPAQCTSTQHDKLFVRVADRFVDKNLEKCLGQQCVAWYQGVTRQSVCSHALHLQLVAGQMAMHGGAAWHRSMHCHFSRFFGSLPSSWKSTLAASNQFCLPP